jgi:DNA-directed RNA polymerase subunit RPC12/RpoP
MIPRRTRYTCSSCGDPIYVNCTNEVMPCICTSKILIKYLPNTQKKVEKRAKERMEDEN